MLAGQICPSFQTTRLLLLPLDSEPTNQDGATSLAPQKETPTKSRTRSVCQLSLLCYARTFDSKRLVGPVCLKDD